MSDIRKIPLESFEDEQATKPPFADRKVADLIKDAVNGEILRGSNPNPAPWANVVKSDPVEDMKRAFELIAKAKPREPHKHMLAGTEGLHKFFRGEAACVECGFMLDKHGDFILCHPDEFELAMSVAWKKQVVIRTSTLCPKDTGQVWLMDSSFIVAEDR